MASLLMVFQIKCTGASVLQAHPASEATNLISLPGGLSTHVIFVNNLDVVARIDWINFKGERQYYHSLSPGQSYKQQTYVNHPWLVCAGSEQSPVAVFHPLQHDAHALITTSLLLANTAPHSGVLEADP